MTRRGMFSLFAALALVGFAGVGADAEALKASDRAPACACCGDACGCETCRCGACACDAKCEGKQGKSCDCCPADACCPDKDVTPSLAS